MTRRRFEAAYHRFLEQWSKAGWERQEQRPSAPAPSGYVRIDGRDCLDFASNDYLGLARRRELARAAARAAEDWGTGSRGSRLLSGDWSLFDALERRIAEGTGQARALLFASGYQANLGVIAALAGPMAEEGDAVLFADRLNHASIHAGCRLARARQHRFRHRDYDHLESLLKRHRSNHRRAWILSETVFSMEGTLADPAALTYLAGKYEAGLYLDDAHGFGVFGRRGFGRAAHVGADLVVGTFGKAAAAMGAYVAGSTTLRRYLLNRCGATIYSTAPPPPMIGVIQTALDLFAAEPGLRRRLRRSAAFVRRRLGVEGPVHSPILPLCVGDEGKARRVAAIARDRGLVIPLIRYPTVPKGTERLRLSLSAAHSRPQLERLVDVLAGAMGAA